MIRFEMMLLAIVIVYAALGAICLVVARSKRRSVALRLFGTGFVIYAVGIVISIARFLPVAFSKIVGNGLIAFAAVPTVMGVLEYTGARLNRKWVMAGLIVTILPLFFNQYSEHYSLIIEYLVPVPLANVLFGFAIITLLRKPLPDAGTAAKFVVGMLISCLIIWDLRVVFIWRAISGSDDRNQADLTISLFSIAQIVIGVAAALGMFWIEVSKMEGSLERIAFTDELTGLPNRRATLARFKEEMARAQRQKHPMAMVVFDIDHFKQFNDRHGHLVGDAVLKHVAEQLQAGKRGEDVLGRIGGEEFVFLCSTQSKTDAMEMANRLREKIASAKLVYDTQTFQVTLSGGLALAPAEGSDWDALFTAADERLYTAKNDGRNRVEGPG